jgi:hypothetical protein
MNKLLAAQFLVWWYGDGWRTQAKSGWRRVSLVSRTFSAPLLLRTLFAPWRRIITYPGASMSAKLQAVGDNMVSRAVGFTIRIFVLITAGVVLFAVTVVAVIQLVTWPLIPPAIVTGIVVGLF